MATENKKYIPALRFPEFQNDGEWSMLELGKFAKIVMGQSPSSEAYNEKGEGVPLLQGNADIKDRHQVVRVYTTDITKTCDINDIIMTVRAPVGTISRASFKSCIGRGVCAIKTDSEYLYQYLISIEQEWDKLASGSTFVSITSNQIFDRIIFVPLTIQEQKKIADCLSSLDKYIDATKRKLELLKEHKKGLMQRLFPAKGKTTPELRFPEFIGTNEWAPKQLGNIGETLGGLSGKSAEDFGTGKPFVTYKQVFNSSEIDSSECALVQVSENETQNKLQYRDVLVTMSSETPDEVGYTAVVTNKNIPECYLNSFCFIYRLFDNEYIDARFLIYLFNNNVYRTAVVRIAQGITRFNISKTKFKEIELVIPENKNEQIKIAETLSSVDKQIAEYYKKIKALELHKKGLMQQLFPKL